MRVLAFIILFSGFLASSYASANLKNQMATSKKKLPVIFDTDTNNELDDQHAMAYLFCNRNYFDIKAITVNATSSGDDIDRHFDEAQRIMTLFKVNNEIPLLKGADKSFTEIKGDLSNPYFDGFKAVNFIISEAKKHKRHKLVVIAVGKLTNLALALKKDPSIAAHIRLVWLGANYPEPGEYNLENDIESMNYVLKTNIEFEMVTVRYGKPSGTDAVRVTQQEVNKNMPGMGPKITNPITGRHGGKFDNFGDYSVNLFTHIDYHGDPPSRALFDMAAVAIVKNPKWAESSTISCPAMIDKKWVEQPDNPRKIVLWEDFEKDEIISDFYSSLKKF
ncbi:nucleoside hydrolase [Fulvivirgaceae bacterium BMA12]|uniref:Nucleoside hydrolase n=1 Tax=Agaribacillus aureus TaxID=3051825 RepID=A0ABT8L989_9BACT|nr:nucleoside hydrolase [Fulvivirgaceae bacterium BMA12]